MTAPVRTQLKAQGPRKASKGPLRRPSDWVPRVGPPCPSAKCSLFKETELSDGSQETQLPRATLGTAQLSTGKGADPTHAPHLRGCHVRLPFSPLTACWRAGYARPKAPRSNRPSVRERGAEAATLAAAPHPPAHEQKQGHTRRPSTSKAKAGRWKVHLLSIPRADAQVQCLNRMGATARTAGAAPDHCPCYWPCA